MPAVILIFSMVITTTIMIVAIILIIIIVILLLLVLLLLLQLLLLSLSLLRLLLLLLVLLWLPLIPAMTTCFFIDLLSDTRNNGSTLPAARRRRPQVSVLPDFVHAAVCLPPKGLS